MLMNHFHECITVRSNNESVNNFAAQHHRADNYVKFRRNFYSQIIWYLVEMNKRTHANAHVLIVEQVKTKKVWKKSEKKSLNWQLKIKHVKPMYLRKFYRLPGDPQLAFLENGLLNMQIKQCTLQAMHAKEKALLTMLQKDRIIVAYFSILNRNR